MNEKLFFEMLYIEGMPADKICADLGIDRKKYTELTKKLDLERADEIRKIRRIRSLYHNKKKKNFDFPNFNSFYKWHEQQWKEQEGKCYYCHTDEHVIATLLEKKYSHRKRLNRGRYLEVERKDATSNKYNSQNCVLACYFCNNDKSDIFNEGEYRAYLQNRKAFLNAQFEQLPEDDRQ